MIQINEQRGKIFKETEVLHRWERIVKARDEGPTLGTSDLKLLTVTNLRLQLR